MNFKDLKGQQGDWDRRSRAAQAAAAQAFDRLVGLTESRDSGQTEHVARFVASAYDGEAFPFDLFMLRMFDVDISDDMLVCIDALRWGKADLCKLIPDGDKRVRGVLALRGIEWPTTD